MDINNIWDYRDSYTEKYRCGTALYLLSVLAKAYYIIIDRGVGEIGKVREVVDGLNATDKQFFSMLKKTVQLIGAEAHETQMEMHTLTLNKDISLAREFQKHLFDISRKSGVMDQGEYRKRTRK